MLLVIETIRDDLKLPDDSEEVPKLNGVVGGSIPNYEIISLLDGKTSHVVEKHLMCSKKKKEKK